VQHSYIELLFSAKKDYEGSPVTAQRIVSRVNSLLSIKKKNKYKVDLDLFE
jgi:hypothetical protein